MGGRASGPLPLSLALILVLVLGLVPACERDRSDRVIPRAEGRPVDEPFADLYVTAGPSPEDSRLYALDLLNLELDRISAEPVLRIVGQCGGRPVVLVFEGRGRRPMELKGQSLKPARNYLERGIPCTDSRADRHIPGWVTHDQAPGEGRIFLTDGLRVAVVTDDGEIEVLGRTELPIWSAVWARR